MTKQKFLSLLNECLWLDNPILAHQPNGRNEDIVLKADGVEFSELLIHRVDMVNGGPRRLTEHWVRYNRWLNKWYFDNAPIGHLSSITELTTLWRASGNSDEEVEKLLKAGGRIKMADGNLRMKAIKILVKLIDEMAGQGDDPEDEEVGRMVTIIEDGLHEAHALGVEAGREGN